MWRHEFLMMSYLEKSDRLGVQSPVMSLSHWSFVGEVNQPSFLQDLGTDPLRLFHGLNQTLDWNVSLDSTTLGKKRKTNFKDYGQCKTWCLVLMGFQKIQINKIAKIRKVGNVFKKLKLVKIYKDFYFL